MYIDTTSYLNSLQIDDTSDSTSTLGKDDFLTILIAQLEYQDPFDPMDEKEMVSQLAQFSSLEQLTNINETLEDATDLMATQTATSAVSFIGKDVYASGHVLIKDQDGTSNVLYSLEEDAASLTAHIYDQDGNLIASVDLGETTAGEYSFSWDGLDSNGLEAEDGSYNVAFSAENADGEEILVSSYVSGLVTGISTEDGSVMLLLESGAEVNLLSVYQVSQHAVQ